MKGTKKKSKILNNNDQICHCDDYLGSMVSVSVNPTFSEISKSGIPFFSFMRFDLFPVTSSCPGALTETLGLIFLRHVCP